MMRNHKSKHKQNCIEFIVSQFTNIEPKKKENEREITVKIGGERSGEKDIIWASPRHGRILLQQLVQLFPKLMLMALAFETKPVE